MASLVKAAILGVVQGITEFLPVSSTAHLLIGERLIGYDDPGGVFTVMIQLGSILAVMWLYRDKIIEVVTGLPSRPGARHFALMVIVATAPALVAGALLSKFVKSVRQRLRAVQIPRRKGVRRPVREPSCHAIAPGSHAKRQPSRERRSERSTSS